MKRVALFALAVVSAVVFAGSLGAVEVGENRIDFKFEESWNTPEGYDSIAAYDGHVVLLEVWATW